MSRSKTFVVLSLASGFSATLLLAVSGTETLPPAVFPEMGTQRAASTADQVVTQPDCSAARLGTAILSSAIGEPVSSVTLGAPGWVEATSSAPAYCVVEGTMAPVDRSTSAQPINFRVVLPATWSHRAAQFGGGGMNGIVPNLTGSVQGIEGRSPLQRGFATYGSDSGHQMGRGGGRGQGSRVGPPVIGAATPGSPPDWALNEEAIRNLGYMQMRKTHDAAMVLMERMYGERPRFNYYFGSSQGGREALTVAERYPKDYDGLIANVPIVNFSSLMLAPELIRIQERPIANWVTPAKVNAIRGEVMRQCDALDGLVDGVVNNYTACRAVFDVTQGSAGSNPWIAKRCPGNVDPRPEDTTAAACLTDGQISTLKLVYSRYKFATPLANGVTSFGMWTPNTDPSGSGLIVDRRFKGQEGAADDAPLHSHLGVTGVTGFLMQNLSANPLDYVEGGVLNARRVQISAWLDATNPDLSAFARRGGKMIVTIGTNDTLASPGAQLDFYQALIDRMGQSTVDGFARLFVIPQVGHGLGGSNYGVDGNGSTIPTAPIPNTYDRLGPLMDWVENKKAPSRTLTVSAGEKTLPLCSYPTYPKYVKGPVSSASSYTCDAR